LSRKKILQKILTDSEPINKVIARARREINLIREYHTRLIADVVTGKLDVRHLPIEKIDEALEDIEEDEVMEVLEAFEDQGEEEEDESSQTC
jgi:type I restriction enzyme, S subunit